MTHVHQSEHAERAVLGDALLENGALDEAQALLPSGELFYAKSRGAIYDAMRRIRKRGEPVELVTLRADLVAHKQLSLAGGDEELLMLTETIPTTQNVEHHARIVRDLAALRSVGTTLLKLQSELAAPIESPREWCVEAEAKLAEAVAQHEETRGPVEIKSCVIETFERVTQLEQARRDGVTIEGAPLPTGFSSLDRKLGGGLRGGELVIVAGRPGMGKTAFALNAAAGLCSAGLPGAIFSLEMTRHELSQRLICAEGRIDTGRLRTGLMTRDDWTRATGAAGAITNWPLAIDDTASANMAYIRAQARRLHARGKLKWTAIDYLQLMTPAERRKDRNRENEVAEISRSAKLLAKELEVPVVLLSQLNREAERRTDKRPTLGDLRESGAIEQDADVILFLYREELYRRDDPEVRGLAEIIIGKQRNGPTGSVKARYFGEYTRFEELHDDDPAQPYGTIYAVNEPDDNWQDRY